MKNQQHMAALADINARRTTSHAVDCVKAMFRSWAAHYCDLLDVEWVATPFDTTVPSTGKAIHTMLLDCQDNGVAFRVLADVENTSLWGRVSNECYRFAHDMDHALDYGAGIGGTTKLVDELKLNSEWIRRVLRGGNPENSEATRIHAAALLAADLLGQAVWYSQTSTFVSDQKAFTLTVYKRLLADCGTLRALHMRVLDILKNPMLISEYL